MKNGRNLLYLLMVVLIVLGSIMLFKNKPNAVAGEQSILGSSTTTATLTDLQEEIKEAFDKMDASALAKLCDEEIQFTHGETDDFFTKEDVETYMKKFFLEMPTKTFSVAHSGSNQGGTKNYLVGELQTTNDKKLRVEISNNKKTIQSIEMNPSREF